MTPNDPSIREPDQIRQDCVRKVRGAQVSDHFRAILGCLLGESWTTPRLVGVIRPERYPLGRCHGDAKFKAFLGASEDRVKSIHGAAPVAELDGDGIGFLMGESIGTEGQTDE